MNTINQAQNAANNALPDGLLGILIKFYDNPFVSKLIDVLFAIAVAAVLLTLSRFVANAIKNRITSNFIVQEGDEVKKVASIIGDVIFYAMAMFSLFISFHIVGIQMGLLMWWISIGVGFAFRETLSNMISWIMIFSTKEYQIGNIIELKMKGQILGRIEEINMRHIVIRTFDLRRVVIPNAKFLKQPVKTYSSEEVLRYEMDVIVDVALDIPKVVTLTVLTVNQFPFVVNKEFTQVLVDAFSDKSVKLKIIFSFNPNAGNTTQSLRSAINEKLVEAYKTIKPTKAEKLVAPKQM